MIYCTILYIWVTLIIRYTDTHSFSRRSFCFSKQHSGKHEIHLSGKLKRTVIFLLNISSSCGYKINVPIYNQTIRRNAIIFIKFFSLQWKTCPQKIVFQRKDLRIHTFQRFNFTKHSVSKRMEKSWNWM